MPINTNKQKLGICNLCKLRQQKIGEELQSSKTFETYDYRY